MFIRLDQVAMAPNLDTSSLPYIDNIIELGTHHSFSISDYVVIHQCKPPCFDCEFVNISSKQALKIGLKDEKMKNEKYREKITELSKKYGQSLRQIEYQKRRIQELSKQLMMERLRGSHYSIEEEYTVIDLDMNLISNNSNTAKIKKKLGVILE